MKSLRGQLILAISIILIVMQSISIAWVWHESQEQIELLVEKALDTGTKDINQIEDNIQEEIHETIAALLLPALTTILVAIILIYLAISHLTRPLTLLTHEIENRTPFNLHPLQIHNASSEIAVVEQTINRLLLRLEHGLENERRFTADVAHELRTPLAGLRLNLELMQQQHIEQAQTLIIRIDQMMISIEQLLQLSRAGQKMTEGHGLEIDLIKEVILPMRLEREDDTSCTYTTIWNTPEHAHIIADSGLIYLLIRNLLENVRNYASESQQVIVNIVQQSNDIAIEVIDEGPGVPQEQIAILTQRFTRLDKTHKGHGLGLNIANRIMQVHQGQLQIENRTDHHGLIVRAIFPSITNTSLKFTQKAYTP